VNTLCGPKIEELNLINKLPDLRAKTILPLHRTTVLKCVADEWISSRAIDSLETTVAMLGHRHFAVQQLVPYILDT